MLVYAFLCHLVSYCIYLYCTVYLSACLYGNKVIVYQLIDISLPFHTVQICLYVSLLARRVKFLYCTKQCFGSGSSIVD